MNLNELFSKAQFNYVSPSYPGEPQVTGFELLLPLLESLLELINNPATPKRLIEEAKEAHFSLSWALKQIWIVSFVDEQENQPQEVAFELNNPDQMEMAYARHKPAEVPDSDQAIRAAQLGTQQNLRNLIETDQATERDEQIYEYITNMISLPFIDSEQIIYLAYNDIRIAFELEAVFVAIHLVLSKRNVVDSSTTTDKILRLYPNSKTIDISRQMGLSKPIADSLFKTIRNVNRKEAIAQYEKSATHPANRKPIFKTKNKGKQPDTEFSFDHDKSARIAITTAQQFADQLMKVRDAKVLQTFFALIKWSNLNDAWDFKDVAVSEIMSLVLKSSADNKFNTPQRREFSEVLQYLTSISLTVRYVERQVNPKTGKEKTMLWEEKGVKLLRMKAGYSVKKQHQAQVKNIENENDIPDDWFDKSVIVRFSGELFPGNNQLFKQRASVYSDTLLTMDANKDNKAILLGYQFETRFNQLGDKEKCIEYDRKGLIDLCDYAKTDKAKPNVATKQLANNLDKLKKNGIISKYSGLTNVNSDVVKIYPPTSTKLATVA